jgi:glycosyltransferase involved in cell wall biosynthesis
MNKKYKIYIFHPYSSIGGADLSISRLIKKLDTKKYDIDFICINGSRINNYLDNKKIKIISIKSSRTLLAVNKIRKHLKKDKKENYDKYIFLSNQNFANIISFLILFNINWIKQILIERNHIDEFKFVEKNLIKNIFIKFLMKILYKRADSIIGISKILSNDLSKYTKKKVITIYNPSFDKSVIKKSKAKISFKKNKKIILNVARLEKQKDHITLLKAFAIVSKSVNCKLIIIGFGSEEKKIKQFIKKEKLSQKIVILTKVQNPFPYYKIADLFVLTSKYEGFGNVLVEAAIFNKPIISSNCNSGPVEILKNGKGGDLFEVGDYKQLSKKIILNLNNKNKSKVLFMKERIKDFNIDLITNKYKKLFKKI